MSLLTEILHQFPLSSRLLGPRDTVVSGESPNALYTLAQIVAGSGRSILSQNGRLTLTPGFPVQNVNITGSSTITWSPYQNNLCSIFNGSIFVDYPFFEQTLTLDPTNFLDGNLYDFFAFLGSPSGNTLNFGYSPAWANSSLGSSSRGTATGITMVPGMLVNSVAMPLVLGPGQTIALPQFQGTYISTVKAHGNGLINFVTANTQAGGGASTLGIYNRNRALLQANSGDSTATWAYGSSTWRAANNSLNNSIEFIDGVGDSTVLASYSVACAGVDPLIGITLDAIGAPGFQAVGFRPSATTTFFGTLVAQIQVAATGVPGLHTLYAVEATTAGAGGFSSYGSGWDANATSTMRLRAMIWS